MDEMLIEEEWKSRAKCKGMDPNFFYPVAPSGRSKNGSLEDQQAEVAKFCLGLDSQFSAICPVKKECLEFSLKTRADEGVWGGTTEGERVRIRRHRRKSA